MNRISGYVPVDLYKDLYHTLFESYLTYGITLWGGVSDCKLRPLFNEQKKVIRILFGDKEKYLDKFRTCARSRSFPHQQLDSEFYIKEHSKPLFNKKEIMSAKNLYAYHCGNEIFKILKYRSPIKIFELFQLSARSSKNLLLITPKQSATIVYRAGTLWNFIRTSLTIDDASVASSILKLN